MQTQALRFSSYETANAEAGAKETDRQTDTEIEVTDSMDDECGYCPNKVICSKSVPQARNVDAPDHIHHVLCSSHALDHIWA